MRRKCWKYILALTLSSRKAAYRRAFPSLSRRTFPVARAVPVESETHYGPVATGAPGWAAHSLQEPS